MKRELSKEKTQLVSNNKKKSKKNNDDDGTNLNDDSDKVKSDIMKTFKSNIQNILEGNIILNQTNDSKGDENKPVNEDYFYLKAKLNKLDKYWFEREYIDYALEINKNLKEFKSKPKYIGVSLQNIFLSTTDQSIKETNQGTFKNTNDSNNFVNSFKKLELEKIKKLNAITEFKIITPLEIFYKHEYEKFHRISDELDKCSICLLEFYDELIEKTENIIKNADNAVSKNSYDKITFNTSASEEIINHQINNNFYDVVLLNDCNDHFFHIDCLLNMIGEENQYAKCPNCNIIYGVMTGDQPPGSMKVTIEKKYKCEGFKKNNTFVIEYNFPNGKNYQGTSRTAYLPDNQEGKEILALLRVAFERRLLFTIGTSVTTGKSNQTIWNGIHQKTNLTGGAQYFGYPDPTYFNRVKNELAAKGVIKDHIEKNEFLIDIADKFIKEKVFSNLEEKKKNSKRKR